MHIPTYVYIYDKKVPVPKKKMFAIQRSLNREFIYIYIYESYYNVCNYFLNIVFCVLIY